MGRTAFSVDDRSEWQNSDEDARTWRRSVCILEPRATVKLSNRGSPRCSRSDNCLMLASVVKDEQRQWLDPLNMV